MLWLYNNILFLKIIVCFTSLRIIITWNLKVFVALCCKLILEKLRKVYDYFSLDLLAQGHFSRMTWCDRAWTIRSKAEVSFSQFPPIVTFYLVTVQYQNQNFDIGTMCIYSTVIWSQGLFCVITTVIKIQNYSFTTKSSFMLITSSLPKSQSFPTIPNSW